MSELVETSRTAALDQVMNRFEEEDRKRSAATCRQLAEAYWLEHWRGERRFELCDAKNVVLPQLRDWLQARCEKSFSDARIASEFRREEIPAEIHELGDKLLSFAGLGTS